MFRLHLNIRKVLGIFERFEKFNFGLVRQRSDFDLHECATAIEPGGHTDHAYACRKSFTEIHKDFGPRKTAFADKGIQETGAVEDLLRLLRLEI